MEVIGVDTKKVYDCYVREAMIIGYAMNDTNMIQPFQILMKQTRKFSRGESKD